ncbi:pyruvate kinase [Desulfovermiculus halophilus]|uniref:pyruvate kinase n=1 Tax=Desulfovermiculus halophilus TaxID=339722 RepID=UPI000483D20D|nr:pyruvate kinase [Desulfovermiculus halophilus]
MRIKTVATLGPKSLAKETMQAMVTCGVRIFRLNFSHGQAEDFAPTVGMIRELEQEMDLPLTIMGDLSGPKIRIDEVQDSPVNVEKHDRVSLGLPQARDKAPQSPFISLSVPELLQDLQEGMEVALSDGMLRFRVQEVIEPHTLFTLQAENAGLLSSHKGITFPGKDVPLAAMTDKDRADLEAGLDIGIDCFALSFVQSEKDIQDLRLAMQEHGHTVPIIAKLERARAVDRLDAILEQADGIMVARGDLGLECPLPQLPILQKQIIRACRHAQKFCIVATQMLLSMVQNPLPTRAETTDVANAIMDGADCVMLSEETAVGNYPVEAVCFIQEIAGQAESYLLERMQGPYRPKIEKNPAKYLAYSACLLADNTESIALACHSTSGTTARLLSSRRPAQPIYALTPDMGIIRLLNFYWGVRPKLTGCDLSNHLDRVETFVQECPLFLPGDRVVITSGQPTPGQQEKHTNQIKIYTK